MTVLGRGSGELARHWLSATLAHRQLQSHRLCPPSGRAPPWPPSLLRTPSATTPRPSTSTPATLTPDPILALDLAIGLGTAQRQPGDPSFRETLLDAARRAADLDDTGASWPPPWPTIGASSLRSAHRH